MVELSSSISTVSGGLHSLPTPTTPTAESYALSQEWKKQSSPSSIPHLRDLDLPSGAPTSSNRLIRSTTRLIVSSPLTPSSMRSYPTPTPLSGQKQATSTMWGLWRGCITMLSTTSFAGATFATSPTLGQLRRKMMLPQCIITVSG